MKQDPAVNSAPNNRLALVAFIAISIAAVYFAFFGLDTMTAEKAFIELGYLNITILSGVFALICGPVLLDGAKKNWRSRSAQTLVATCIIAAYYLYTREGGGFKISFDEEVLTNVAQNLHSNHLPLMRESTLQGIASFEMIDKRPLFFPYLLSLVYSIFGYNVSYVFYLNFFLTGVFLLLLSLVVRRVSTPAAGYFSIALACFMPLIGQNASGGGFDMLNICLVLFATWLAIDFWEKPNNRTLARLALATALASHVRYESSLIAIPVLALIVTHWFQAKRISIPKSLLLIPITYIPIVWQTRAISSNPERFQYKASGSGSFSFDYVLSNLDLAYRFLLLPDENYAGSPFVAFIGIAGVLCLLGLLATSKTPILKNNRTRIALVTMALYPITHFGLILTFYFGQLTDPIVSRLGLPILILLFISGGLLLSALYSKKGAYRATTLILLLASGLYASKSYAKHRYSSSGPIVSRSEWALGFANELPKGNYLFISTMPRVFEIHGYNNMSSSRAREALEAIKTHLELKTYDDVYVIQNCRVDKTETGEIVKSLLPYNDFGPAVKLELIDEVSFIPYNRCQISKIASIDMSLFTSYEPEKMQLSESAQVRRLQTEEVEKWRNSLP